MTTSPLSWPVALLYAGLWLLGRLPLAALQAVGALAGRTLSWLPGREARVTAVNLRLCRPDAAEPERCRLARECLAHVGRTALETCAIWTRPWTESSRWIVDAGELERLDIGRDPGQGLIVAAPHLGNWELLNACLAARGPLAIVYRAPERRALEALLLRVRSHPGIEQLRAEPASVRRMLSLLRAGGTLGILPDQRPKAGEGVLAPLFGVPARTMTLLPKLAQKTGARVCFAFAERLPAAAGFRIRVLEAPPGLHDPDPAVSAAALNAGIEACVALAPAQYQWNYKRYPAEDAQGRPRYRGGAADV